ncbi:hypothetical protein G6F44_009785 [Rhizopus delemar]|nr:hypothetical protein G6F44_009785 [Rhizopus delemar]
MLDSAQYQTQDVLELSSRPRSQSSGCFSPSLAQEGFVPVSTMATDTEGFTTNTVDEVEESGIGHPMVADPILVSDTITNKTSTTTADIQEKKGLDSSRLAPVRNKWTSDGISKRTREFFLRRIVTIHTELTMAFGRHFLIGVKSKYQFKTQGSIMYRMCKVS